MYRQQGRDVDEFVIREVVPKIPRAKAKIKMFNQFLVEFFWKSRLKFQMIKQSRSK